MRKESEEWLKIALEEFHSAEYLFEKKLWRMVCYHAQQTVEKILKAFLTEKEIYFAWAHNILDLRNAAISAGYKIELSDEDSVFLNSIYRSRYPSDLGLLPSGEPIREDAEKALNIAKKILSYAQDLSNCKL